MLNIVLEEEKSGLNDSSARAQPLTKPSTHQHVSDESEQIKKCVFI